MKPLDQLNNVERAKLLHELFPRVIPRFLEFTANLCEVVLEDQEKITRSWDNPLITAQMWLDFAKDTARKINSYGKKFHRSARLFADQLFDGYEALFLSHCLHQYTKVRRCEEAKFTAAAELLFKYQPKEK